jgi:E3 ubiquitin-protein ligase BRE1
MDLSVQKAKLENKFYAAMRDKEAIDQERKNLTRNGEKQMKALERLAETEKTLREEIRRLEREVEVSASLREIGNAKLIAIEREGAEWRRRAEYEKTRVEAAAKHVEDANRAVEKQRADLRHAEEDALRAKKDAERASDKAKASAARAVGTGSSREAELQGEVDKCMSILKCSTCRMRMRNTVITKCMHCASLYLVAIHTSLFLTNSISAFCKECVAARVATRQRKCPACNLPFAQSEVAQIYFQ